MNLIHYAMTFYQISLCLIRNRCFWLSSKLIPSQKDTKKVILMLSNVEAIVLFEWLSKFNEKEHLSLFEDKAEQRVLFYLEVILEKALSQTFEGNYKNILSNARDKLRDVES
jgi:hypothetical protein